MKPDSATLLIEIRTEELPPNEMGWVHYDFTQNMDKKLREGGFLSDNRKSPTLMTPRRLTLVIPEVRAQAESKRVFRRGPRVESCYHDGKPTKALQGFLSYLGAEESQLHTVEEKGREYVAWAGEVAGGALRSVLCDIVEGALREISAPRLMRWGVGEFRFIRPVRGVLLLHGSESISGEVMGVSTSDYTVGRTGEPITIAHADEYQRILKDGGVIVDYAVRRGSIIKQRQRTRRKTEHRRDRDFFK